MPDAFTFEEAAAEPTTGQGFSFEEATAAAPAKGFSFEEATAPEIGIIEETGQAFSRGRNQLNQIALMAGRQALGPAPAGMDIRGRDLAQRDPRYVYGMSDAIQRQGAEDFTAQFLGVPGSNRGEVLAANVEATLGPEARGPQAAMRDRQQILEGAIADIATEGAALPQGSATLQEFKQGENWLGTWVRNPVRVTAALLGESLPVAAPTMAAGMAAGPGGVFAGSAATEYVSALGDVAAKAGLNLTDEGDVAALFNDPGLMRQARERGLKRGIAVGAFDALTAGLAGRLLGRALPTRAAGPIVAATLGETAVQAAGGAAGEAIGQIATEGKVTSGRDVFAEAVAELGTLPSEALSNLRGRNKAPGAPVDLPATITEDPANEFTPEPEEGRAKAPAEPFVPTVKESLTVEEPFNPPKQVKEAAPDFNSTQGLSEQFPTDLEATPFDAALLQGQRAKQTGGPEQAPQPPVTAPTSEAGSGTGISPATVDAPAKPVKPRQLRTREVVGDILDEIEQAGGLVSRSQAQKRGLLKADKNAPEYDDVPKLTRATHNFIYGNGRGGPGSLTPDKMVEALASNPKYADMSVPEMWAAIDAASRNRWQQVQRGKSEATQIKAEAREARETGRFEAANTKSAKQGDRPVAVDDLAIGARLTLDGEKFTVLDIDVDTGDVVMQDGPRFGRQRLKSGEVVYVERLRQPKVEDSWGAPAVDRVESFLDSIKVDTSGKVFDAVAGLPVAVWNGLVETVRLGYRGGKALTVAIQDGVDWLRTKHPEATFDEPQLRAILGRAVEENLSATGEKVLAADFSGETLANVAELSYEPRPQETDRQSAQRILDTAPFDEVVAVLTREGPSTIPGPVRSILFDLALERAAQREQIASLSGNAAESSRLARQQAELIESNKGWGTDIAQSLAAMRRFGMMSVGGIITTARRAFDKAVGEAGQAAQDTAAAIRRAFDEGFAAGRKNAMNDAQVNRTLREGVDESILNDPAILLEAGRAVGPLEARKRLIKQRLDEIRRRRLERIRRTVASGVPPEEVPADPLDRLIRDELRRKQAKLGQIVRQSDELVDSTGKTLGEQLAEATGIPGGGKTRIGRVLQERFKAIVAAERRRALQRLAKASPEIPRKVKAEFEKLLERVNLGLFNDRQLYQAVAEKYGLPVWTPEIQSDVNRRAAAIQKLPKDSLQRQRATQELMTYLAVQAKQARWALPMAFWYANALSGPFTHLKNLIGNLSNGAVYAGLQMIRRPSDIPLMVQSIGQGLRSGALDAADVFLTGQQTGERFAAKIDAAPVIERAGKWALPWKLVWRTLAAEDLLFFRPQEELRASVEAARIARGEGLTGQTLKQRVADIMGRTPEKVTAARNQAHAEGLTGRDFKRRVDQIIQQSRPEALRETARDYALRSTFNQKPEGVLGILANKYNEAAGKMSEAGTPGFATAGAVMRLLVPFTSVITNVVNEGLMYTPVGLGRAMWGQYKGTMMGRPVTSGEVADTYAKAGAGLAMIAGIVALAAKYQDDDDPLFAVYGSGPKNKAQREALMQLGWRPYTVKVGDKYVAYSQLPAALALSWVGNYLDAMRWKDLDQTDALNRVAVATAGFGRVITDQSWLDGMAGFLGSLDRDPDTKRAGEKAVQQAARTLSTFVVPNAVNQIEQLFDPTKFDKSTVQSAIVGTMPIARRTLKPAINALGEPITEERIRQFISTAKVDPLWQTLNAKGAWPTVPERDIVVGSETWGEGKFRTLTPDERYDYIVESGTAIRRALTNNLDNLKAMDPEQARKYVRAEAERLRTAAKAKRLATVPKTR